MPTTATRTFDCARIVPLEESLVLDVRLKPSTTYQKGSLIGEISGSRGLFADYASGNVDGTETPKAILPYACATDSAGLITFGDVSTGGEVQEKHQVAPAIFLGVVKTADLPQTGVGAIDATAITNAGWKLLQGDAADGILSL